MLCNLFSIQSYKDEFTILIYNKMCIISSFFVIHILSDNFHVGMDSVSSTKEQSAVILLKDVYIYIFFMFFITPEID
jgi:hypothetical protein